MTELELLSFGWGVLWGFPNGGKLRVAEMITRAENGEAQLELNSPSSPGGVE